MEGIIIVIFIIIAFNLLNLFLKVARGERGGQKKDNPTGIDYPTVIETEAKLPEEATFSQEANDENQKEYLDVADDYAFPSPVESVKPPDLASNLKNALGQKESLAAAVIVHEILSHPPAKQKRR